MLHFLTVTAIAVLGTLLLPVLSGAPEQEFEPVLSSVVTATVLMGWIGFAFGKEYGRETEPLPVRAGRRLGQAWRWVRSRATSD